MRAECNELGTPQRIYPQQSSSLENVGLAIGHTRTALLTWVHCVQPMLIKGGDKNSDRASVRMDFLFKAALCEQALQNKQIFESVAAASMWKVDPPICPQDVFGPASPVKHCLLV